MFSCTLGVSTEKGCSGISYGCHIELEHDITIVYVCLFVCLIPSDILYL